MPTAILSALPEEQAGLLAALQQPTSTPHAGRTVWRGALRGRAVVLALSGIGKVAAATTATALVERFGVRRMVFTGVAGGLGAGVQVGDVVVARQYLQHDMDASPIFPRWELPGYGRTLLPCDERLSDALAQSAAACLPQLAQHARVHQGLVASGDRFVSAQAESHALRTALAQAGHAVLAVEMEGAAVAQVCHDYGVPFAALRIISDRADDAAHVDFTQFVRDVARRYDEHILGDWLQRLD